MPVNSHPARAARSRAVKLPPRTDARGGGSTSTPPRSPCTCGSLRRASRRISQLYDAALAPVGLKSTQYSILTELERGGPGSMSELAAALVMDRSTLGHNVRPLLRDGLIALRASARDARRRDVVLTRKGRSDLARSHPLWKQAESRFERVFGRRAAADLRATLLAIAGNDLLAWDASRADAAAGA